MNKGRFLPRRQRDNPVIREYEQAVQRGRQIYGASYHVVPDQAGWTVKRAKGQSHMQFDTQSEAIDAGKRVAKQQRSELFIHGRDGRIRERNSYGNDPFPPRG